MRSVLVAEGPVGQSTSLAINRISASMMELARVSQGASASLVAHTQLFPLAVLRLDICDPLGFSFLLTFPLAFLRG